MPGTPDHPSDDTRMRLAAFEHIRRLTDAHDHLTSKLLSVGFTFPTAFSRNATVRCLRS